MNATFSTPEGIVVVRPRARSGPVFCACGAPGVAFCDGRVPGAEGHTRRCNAGLCDDCAAPAFDLGDDRHRCPACVIRHRGTRNVLLPRDEGAIVAYTDGSGTVADQPCGIGVVLCWRAEVILEVSVGYDRGTNNAAELLAIRHALWAAGAGLMGRRPLEVRTDSMYCIDALRAAYDPHPRATNATLITAIRARIAERPGRVYFFHVRGHTGEPGNTRADQLAGRARRAIVDARRGHP